jgi:hypothetical protein
MPLDLALMSFSLACSEELECENTFVFWLSEFDKTGTDFEVEIHS